MAIRSKTPSAPAKRAKKTSGESAPATAPAKAGGRRKSGAAEQPAEQSKVQSASAQETSSGLTAPQAVELVPDAPPASTGASAGREDRAGRALDALKLLGEIISEGVDTLRELRAEMRAMSGRLDQLAAGMPTGGQAGSGGPAATDADDDQVGRDHDPGDAVPPGVAVMSPTPLSDTDEQALHSLEELPKRGRQGKRGSRAKA